MREPLSTARRVLYALGNPGFQVTDRLVVLVAVYYYLPPPGRGLEAQVPTSAARAPAARPCSSGCRASSRSGSTGSPPWCFTFLLARYGNSPDEPWGVVAVGPVAALFCLAGLGFYSLYPERAVLAEGAGADA